MLNFSFLSRLILVVLLLLMTLTCKKDKEEIPNVAVNIYIYPNSTQYVQLNTNGGWVYLTGGVRGIIVYRRTQDEFVAFERNCPYLPSSTCALVSVEQSGLTLLDSCCGSRFIITDGSIVNGPASVSMKTYYTAYDGNALHIYN